MRKYLFLAFLCISTTVIAQKRELKRINIDTWNKIDVAAYDKQNKDVHMARYMFKGWNTLCIPFAINEAQIDSIFGKDCKVETLVGVEGDANNVTVYFDNAKTKGIEANKPYIVYYSGDSKYISVNVPNVTIDASGEKSISFSSNDADVSFNGTLSYLDGKEYYGIYVKNNTDATFSPVDAELNGFYPTRCFLSVNGTNSAKVTIKHGPTSIDSIVTSEEKNTNIRKYNISGQQVDASHKGVVIQNGKKYIAR